MTTSDVCVLLSAGVFASQTSRHWDRDSEPDGQTVLWRLGRTWLLTGWDQMDFQSMYISDVEFVVEYDLSTLCIGCLIHALCNSGHIFWVFLSLHIAGVGARGHCFSTWTCEEFPGLHNTSLMALEQCCSNLWGLSWRNASDQTCLSCTYMLLPGY